MSDQVRLQVIKKCFFDGALREVGDIVVGSRSMIGSALRLLDDPASPPADEPPPVRGRTGRGDPRYPAGGETK